MFELDLILLKISKKIENEVQSLKMCDFVNMVVFQASKYK